MSEDKEVTAMAAIAAALADLDRPACSRVVEWARTRYVEAPWVPFDQDGFHKFMESLAEASRRLGYARPLDVLRAAMKLGIPGAETAIASAEKEAGDHG